jgi:Xaa-Pro aminopeptidase
MTRAIEQAGKSGLHGLVIAPGPDLQYFCGYIPTAILERPTLLVLAQGRDPTMLVPVLERPDAEEAPGASEVQILGFADGENPYSKMAGLLERQGSYAVSDNCWAMHILGLQKEVPGSRYESVTKTLPMLRAVKDDEELGRLAAAAAAADACFPEIQ